MYNWKKDRNYRPVRNEDGDVIAGSITVYDTDVTVTEDVYRGYSRIDRHFRYLIEKEGNGQTISLDMLLDAHVPVDQIAVEPDPGFEGDLLEVYETAYLIRILRSVLPTLDEEEQELIRTLYYEGVSMREYARRLGVHHSTVQERRDKALSRLRAAMLRKIRQSK